MRDIERTSFASLILDSQPGHHRSTQRKIAMTPDDESPLTAYIMALALQYDRYGYSRITTMLHQAGWIVNVKRVERIW